MRFELCGKAEQPLGGARVVDQQRQPAAIGSNLASIGEQGPAVREQAFREAVSGLKDAVTSRFVRM